jgi:hypothetical protein
MTEEMRAAFQALLDASDELIEWLGGQDLGSEAAADAFAALLDATGPARDALRS